MASGTFLGVRIHPVDDPADELVLDSTEGMKVTTSEQDDDLGGVTIMANGRLRAVTASGRPRSISISALYATRETKEHLESFRNRLLCFRDYPGNLLYGMIFGRRPQAKEGVDRYDLNVTFTAVSHDPEV
jgi:hypothetical protein